MTFQALSTVLAAPILRGTGLRWFLVVAVLVGVVVAIVLVRTGRRPSAKQDPPLRRPRLLPQDDRDPD